MSPAPYSATIEQVGAVLRTTFERADEWFDRHAKRHLEQMREAEMEWRRQAG